MKKLMLVFVLLLIGLLGAQTPNPNDVWVIDLHSPQLDKSGWTKPWWQIQGIDW